MIKVMAVDDHELVRSGIVRILKDIPEIEVIAEADCGEEALKLARQLVPDVVLMDVNMPGIGGLEATRKILKICPDTKVLVVTVHMEGPFPTRFIEAGASGYITKDCGVEEILCAIKTVSTGRRYLGRDVSQNLAFSCVTGNNEDPLAKLSARELQVMLMIVQGLKVQDISETLCLSPKTVSTYRYRLFEKLGIQSDAKLTQMAMTYGLLGDDN
jgi:two-component system invasion response regulator UvrY